MHNAIYKNKICSCALIFILVLFIMFLCKTIFVAHFSLNQQKELTATLGNNSQENTPSSKTVDHPQAAILEVYTIRQGLFAKKVRIWTDDVKAKIVAKTPTAKASDVTKANALVAKIDTNLATANTSLNDAWNTRITDIDTARKSYTTATKALSDCVDQMATLAKSHKWIWN